MAGFCEESWVLLPGRGVLSLLVEEIGCCCCCVFMAEVEAEERREGCLEGGGR